MSICVVSFLKIKFNLSITTLEYHYLQLKVEMVLACFINVWWDSINFLLELDRKHIFGLTTLLQLRKEKYN